MQIKTGPARIEAYKILGGKEWLSPLFIHLVAQFGLFLNSEWMNEPHSRLLQP